MLSLGSMQSEYCPLCSKNGAKVRVEAYQLNFQEAVFMCSTDDCTWPAGYHDVLFMDRPMGKYYSKDWPAVADKYLAEHLKKQRATLSELSAYTPPTTPDDTKDIHDTASSSMAGPSSLPVVEDTEILGQQPSTSKSQPIEIPVINLTDDDSSTGPNKSFRMPVISNTSLVRSTIDNKPVSLESKSNLNVSMPHTRISLIKKDKKTFPPSHTSVVDPSPKHSALLDNKIAAVNNVKANPVPEKRILLTDNVQPKKFYILGKKKSKSCNYIKPFDLFDQIRKEKSAEEQSKVPIPVKSMLDLSKMKPDETGDATFVKNDNNLVNVRKINSTTNYTMRLESRSKLIRVEREICQSNVNSQIDVKKISDASSLIQTLSGDQDSKDVNKICLELSKKETIKDDNIHYDMDKMINASSSKLESDKNWLADHDNLDSMLAMLDGGKAQEQSLRSDDKSNDTSNSTLPSEPLKSEKNEDSDHDILLCSLDDGEDSLFTSFFSTMED